MATTYEAAYRQPGCNPDFTPVAAVTGGEVVVLPDGRAAVSPADIAAGKLGAAQTEGVYEVQKTSNIAFIDGQEVFWDYSANKAHFKPVNDRDFFLGKAVGDAAASATTMLVEINVRPTYLIDLSRDSFQTVLVGSAALNRRGGANELVLASTSEAEKVDALSTQGVATGARMIVEMQLNVLNDGAGSAADFSCGLANGTHATDGDSIGEHLFVHLDANNANINMQSKDGTTTVTVTDTTVDYVEGTPFLVVFDIRDNTDIQAYVDMVNVLPASVFKLNAAAGPLKLLAHLEKTSAADVYQVQVEKLRIRLASQS